MEINCWTIEGRRRVGAGGNRTSTALDACLIICFFYGGWGEEKEKENSTSFPTRGPESWYIPSIGSWILIHIHFSSEIPWLLDIILFNFWSYKTGHLIPVQWVLCVNGARTTGWWLWSCTPDKSEIFWNIWNYCGFYSVQWFLPNNNISKFKNIAKKNGVWKVRNFQKLVF